MVAGLAGLHDDVAQIGMRQEAIAWTVNMCKFCVYKIYLLRTGSRHVFCIILWSIFHLDLARRYSQSLPASALRVAEGLMQSLPRKCCVTGCIQARAHGRLWYQVQQPVLPEQHAHQALCGLPAEAKQAGRVHAGTLRVIAHLLADDALAFCATCYCVANANA